MGILNNGMWYKTIGYADDISIIIRGDHPGTIEELMQDALNTTWEWCRSEGLSINPKDNHYILYQEKGDKISILRLNNTEKYLGVILDSKLTWELHLKAVQRRRIRISGL
ncbi:hypothetical protein EVAR_73700_1 [Eumeta japonica]|uniref:Reverse transcriptase domain-containing protein n=1 Tax=Eumeta variegata TaxID=151549 RepID=A0A4C1T585_EUMVA|nr:hypothetical protein EVAR_73700_1 [Eumeta japonica]